MTLVQKVESKFIAKYFLMSLLVVNNCLLNLVCCKPLETCPTECTCEVNILACSNLDLKEIPTTILAEKVLSFDFSHNKLTRIMDFVFLDYPDLEILNLSENEIEKIYPGAFHGLARLNNIDLSYNNLRYIKPAIFSDNLVLERVSFRGNQLAYFPDSPPILASLSIESLDLSHCTLTSVNADTFSQLPKIKVLNLNSNRLREINCYHLNTLTDLINVDLRNNFWKCDCKFLEVLKMVSNRRKATSVEEEHKPVECFEEGEYKNISKAEIEKSCTEQAEKEGSTFLEPNPEERASQQTSTFSGPKDIMKKTCTGENIDTYTYTICIVIVTLGICGAVFSFWSKKRMLHVLITQTATAGRIKESEEEKML